MSIVLLLALAATLFAGTIAGSNVPTDLTGFPPCAQTCISDNHGSCALLDMDCMCTHQVPTIFSCMQGACDAVDQATTLDFAKQLCDQVNATATATSTSTSKATGSASTNSVSSSPSSSPPVEPQKAALSKASMAGIGVGSAVGAAALAAGLLFVWRRRRERRRALEGHGPAVREVENAYAVPPNYGFGQKTVHLIHHEADGVQWMELEAKEASRIIR